VYTDDLAKCLVEKTTASDRSKLVEWIFSVLSTNPKVASLTTLTTEQRNAYTRKTAQLFERLLTVDCRDESLTAIRYDGAGAIEKSFSLLGEVAMRDFSTDPVVAAQFQALEKFVDKQKIEALGKEASAPVPAPAK
jgi:carboxypeptidase C (cathepsin A)